MQNKESNKQPEANAVKLQRKLKETWGKLTESDVELFSSNREQFIDKLTQYYGLSAESAEIRINALEEACGCSSNRAA